MDYLTPLRHGQGVRSLALVLVLVLLLWFVPRLMSSLGWISPQDEGFPMSTVLLLLATMTLLLGWGLYYQIRHASRSREPQPESGRRETETIAARERGYRGVRRRMDAWLRQVAGDVWWRPRRSGLETWLLVMSAQDCPADSLLSRLCPVRPLASLGPLPAAGGQSFQAFGDVPGHGGGRAAGGTLRLVHGVLGPDTDPADSEAVWHLLVQRTQRRRTGLPYQGVLLLLRLEDLSDTGFLQRLGLVLRTLGASMGGRLPLYLILTDLERLPAFRDFGASLPAGERQQPLGVRLNPLPDGGWIPPFREAWDELAQRLDGYLLRALQTEASLTRRRRLFPLTGEIRRLGGQLEDALGYCLSPAAPGLWLRALHLTARLPADRGRNWLPSAASGPSPDFDDSRNDYSLTAGGAAGASLNQAPWLFSRRWWPDVAEPDRGLAQPGRRWRRRYQLRQTLGLAACLISVGLAIGWQVNTFIDQQKRLERVRLALAREEAGTQAQERLDLGRLRRWTELAQAWMAESEPLGWPGLSFAQGLTEPLARYRGALHREQLLPELKRQLETALREQLEQEPSMDEADMAPGASAQPLMATLEIYLMLAHPDRRDPAAMAHWLGHRLSVTEPAPRRGALGREGVASDWLETRVREALELAGEAIPVDERLIQAVWNRLHAEPPAQGMYRRLQQLAWERGLRDFELDGGLGYRWAEVFDGAPVKIPGFYTREGFQLLKPELDRLLAEYEDMAGLLRNLGGSTARTPESDGLRAAVMRAYAEDYVRHWRAALDRLNVRRVRDLAGLLALSDLLAGPASPLRPMLEDLRAHTDPVAWSIPQFLGQAAAGLTAAVEGRAVQAIPGFPGAQIARPDAGSGPAARVSASLAAGLAGAVGDSYRNLLSIREPFRDLHQMVQAREGQAVPLQSLQDQLGAVRDYLGALTRDRRENALFEASLRRYRQGTLDPLGNLRLAGQHLPEPVRSWVGDFCDQAWSLMLAETRRHIAAAFEAELMPFYRAHLAGRYPFETRASLEAGRQPFAEYFRPGGIEERFFQRYIEPFLEMDAGTWRQIPVEGRTLGLRDSILRQFQRAQRIRQALFGDQPEFQVRLQLRPLFLEANLSRFELSLDGQRLSYRHGPQRPVSLQWPGSGAASGLTVTFEDYHGRQTKRSFEGDWGLPRLLELFEVQVPPAGGPYQLTLAMDGRRVVYGLQDGLDVRLLMDGELSRYRLGALFSE